ncbi:hypothetical protein [Pectobacterium brasiliense]|uniref:hypothetical protein n=1 Tax=Pectobacterium brasiliense TaxID=180957 RepID=UPI0001A4400C|nr:hypothetical protein [Pectobacterium brasiliense]
MLLIAGLSKPLEGKSGGVYKWGNKLNQKKLAEHAVLAVGSVLGENTPDKTESFRKLLKAALGFITVYE